MKSIFLVLACVAILALSVHAQQNEHEIDLPNQRPGNQGRICKEDDCNRRCRNLVAPDRCQPGRNYDGGRCRDNNRCICWCTVNRQRDQTSNDTDRDRDQGRNDRPNGVQRRPENDRFNRLDQPGNGFEGNRPFGQGVPPFDRPNNNQPFNPSGNQQFPNVNSQFNRPGNQPFNTGNNLGVNPQGNQPWNQNGNQPFNSGSNIRVNPQGNQPPRVGDQGFNHEGHFFPDNPNPNQPLNNPQGNQPFNNPNGIQPWNRGNGLDQNVINRRQ